MAFRHRLAAAALLTGLGALAASGLPTARGQTPADPTAEGKRVYQRANCMGCHKWHGDGGGGYGGDALSLRRTRLDRAQIIETVSCGRPGTGMPYHLRGAYDTIRCYGMTRAEMDGQMPPEAAAFLRPPEIEAVADYVIAHIRGKGEPDLADCAAFFGTTSHVCDIYRGGHAGTPAQAGP
jgi:mono/diheme cytochrome c family protein